MSTPIHGDPTAGRCVTHGTLTVDGVCVSCTSRLDLVLALITSPHVGFARQLAFPNGYVASVIEPCDLTDQMWEIAVMLNGSIVYDTPVESPDRVCTQRELEHILRRIAKLPCA